MKIVRLLGFVALFFLLQSCGSIKKYVVETISESNDVELIEKVENQYIEYESLEIKAKVKADFIDRKNPLKVSIRIKKDSIVWMSLNLSSGLPVAKASFTTDSIRILDRINNKVYIGDYHSLRKRKGVDLNYNLLQSIFVNEMMDYDGSLTIVDQKIVDDETRKSLYCVFDMENNSQAAVTYNINENSYKVDKVNFLHDKNSIDVVYSDFGVLVDRVFPFTIKLKSTSDTKSENINIAITKVHKDKKQRYPLKVIKRFEVISL